MQQEEIPAAPVFPPGFEPVAQRDYWDTARSQMKRKFHSDSSADTPEIPSKMVPSLERVSRVDSEQQISQRPAQIDITATPPPPPLPLDQRQPIETEVPDCVREESRESVEDRNIKGTMNETSAQSVRESSQMEQLNQNTNNTALDPIILPDLSNEVILSLASLVWSSSGKCPEAIGSLLPIQTGCVQIVKLYCFRDNHSFH